MDLHTRMSIKALRNLFLCSPVSEREEGFGRRVNGSMEGKHNVGLVRKALLCIRSKRCSRAVCAVILPYVTLRERNAKRRWPFDQTLIRYRSH